MRIRKSISLRVPTIILVLLALAAGAAARAEDPEDCRSPWGPEDQRGAANRLTPAKTLEAARLITQGKIYQLGRVYEAGMPLYGTRSYISI